MIFGVVFTHVARLLGWQCALGTYETNLYEFGTYHTEGMEPIRSVSLKTDKELLVACPLERKIISQEGDIWDDTETDDEYFAVERDSTLRATVRNPNKLLKVITG